MRSFAKFLSTRSKFGLTFFRTDDFLWGGSGDGSVVSDHDGGLAWEDSGGSQGDVRGSVILVTKTMVFFKTVLTTVYPVEPTPTVIVSTAYVTRTPYLPDESPTLSLPYYSSHVTPTSLIDIEPSPTFSFPVEPTASPTPSTETNGTTDVEEIPTPAPDTFASGNPIYWVNTVIKANASEVTDQSPQFQDNMQKNLARVYASAFKRHLLNSLGLLNKSSEDGMESTLRRRRAAIQVRKKENRDYDWLFLSSPIPNGVLNSLALTAMNVSVAIVNITTEEETPKVSMEYIVLAEGKPVTAVAAVQDMRLVTKSEMESEIGYEILKKAEGRGLFKKDFYDIFFLISSFGETREEDGHVMPDSACTALLLELYSQIFQLQIPRTIKDTAIENQYIRLFHISFLNF